MKKHNIIIKNILLFVIVVSLLIISCTHKSKNLDDDNVYSIKGDALSDNVWQELAPKKSKNEVIKFAQPRAVGVSEKGDFYIIDRSGKIFVFDKDKKYLFDFTLPDFEKGTPTGIGFDNYGNILIPDTHYNRILIFNPQGKEIWRFGEYGEGEGKLIYPTDVAVDKDGFFYVTDYGFDDKITKFDKNGKYVKHWGKRGDAPGEMYRPMSIELNLAEEIIVADSCNHRIQCFTKDGEFIRCFGKMGSGDGELRYPYDLTIDDEDNIYVIEYGGCRISKFSRMGEFLESLGNAGMEKMQFHSPWGISVFGKDALLVADTLNHRVVVIKKF